MFGGLKAGRNYSAGNYRYEAKGQENAEGQANWSNFELRMLNKDLGRWMTPDPYGQFHSPYLAMGNNPVSNVDPDGGLAWYFGNSRYYRQYYEWTRQEPNSDIVRRYMGVQREFRIRELELSNLLAEQRAAFRRDHPTAKDKEMRAFEEAEYRRLRANAGTSPLAFLGADATGSNLQQRAQDKVDELFRPILGEQFFVNQAAQYAEVQRFNKEMSNYHAALNDALNANNRANDNLRTSHMFNKVALEKAQAEHPDKNIIVDENGNIGYYTVGVNNRTDKLSGGIPFNTSKWVTVGTFDQGGGFASSFDSPNTFVPQNNIYSLNDRALFNFEYLNMEDKSSAKSNVPVAFDSEHEGEIPIQYGTYASTFYTGLTTIFKAAARHERHGASIFKNGSKHEAYDSNRHYFRYAYTINGKDYNNFVYGSVSKSVLGQDGINYNIIWPR